MALVDYNAGTHPGIRIDDAGGGAATFAASVKEALGKIASQPVGARLLAEISARNATVTFGGWGGIVKIYRAALDVKNGGSKAAPVSENNATNGTGSPSGVAWNTNIWMVPNVGQRPPFIGLAHELIHAWHNAHGTKKDQYDDEENFTVGLGAYMLPNPLAVPASITENMIRLEHNIAIRHRY